MDDLMKLVQECVDRTRRIETRLTKYLTALGFETGVRKPIWTDGAVEVPSLATSLVDILSVIPDDWDPDRENEVSVLFQGAELGLVVKP